MKITKLFFEEGGFFGVPEFGEIDLLNKTFKYSKGILDSERSGSAVKNDLNEEQIKSLQERIADLHLEDWQDEYSDNDILDGTQWSLKISFDNGKSKEIFGSNKYPDNFEAMKKLFDIN